MDIKHTEAENFKNEMLNNRLKRHIELEKGPQRKKAEIKFKGEAVEDEVNDELNEFYAVNLKKKQGAELPEEPAKLKKQALIDDILMDNRKFHTSLAEKKRIWIAGGDEPRRFKKEDLLAWYRVWN